MEPRFEIKYELAKKDFYKIFQSFLKNYRFIKEYPSREVYSLYYDDINLKSLLDNVSGNSKRVKLRLRWYERFENIINAVLEIKKKDNKVTSKITNKLMLKLDPAELDFLLNKKKIFKKYFSSDNLENEIFFKNKINYRPKIYIKYTREYYKFDNFFRITFDSFISYKLYNWPEKVWKNDDKCIIEIKCPKTKMVNYLNLVKQMPLIAKRNSKYVRGMSIYNKTNYF